MEDILFFVLEFFGEFLLELIIEALFESGAHAVPPRYRKETNPILAAIGYGLFGAIAGGLSLLVFPHLAIRNPTLQLANLSLTPFAVGGSMALIGHWRAAKGQNGVRFDRFAYAFLFALGMSLSRYLFAT